ncbi:MAG: hypothetical protein A07HB70_01778 [uncultured archaeon A07HB70]|nr:MAG: hypothetical protein A07HB70_01778 [uncultured archaeon A07HB70]
MGTTPPRKYTPTLHPASELGTGERVYNPTMEKKDYDSSNRRKFLIGAGSVVAGASALFGTAATTTFNLNDRAVTANVVTDSSGAVALTDTEDPGTIINLTSGELEIDFTEGDATGVNIGSKVTIGDTTDPSNDPAFTITNQTTASVELEVEFEGNGFSANSGGSTLKFVLEDTNTSTQKTLTADATNVSSTNGTESVTFSGASEEIASGENLDVAISVNADNGSSGTGEDLSGVLNITATQG